MGISISASNKFAVLSSHDSDSTEQEDFIPAQDESVNDDFVPQMAENITEHPEESA